jgi:DGQHR domain-containing protein
MDNKFQIPCIEVEQPIGTFYIGAIKSEDLLKISYADIRRVQDRDFELYLGIQRPLSPNRVKELKQYVTNIDATFPTSIILSISSLDAFYNKKKKVMEIKREERVAKIIDGQHRIAGLENYKSDTSFYLNVTIFIDMDIENQAMVFGTINLAQTKVNKSLVYDLFDLTKTRSPQKISHNIAIFLNTTKGSPFYGRIKRLGVASEKNQTLTQAAIVESLLKYISGDTLASMKDRDLLLRGKKLDRAVGKDSTNLILRDYFIDKKDVEITRSIWNYFIAVSNKWPNAWKDIDLAGNILPRTNGYRALMRLFKPVFLYLEGNIKVPSIDDYLGVINSIRVKDSDFTTDKYKPGTSGESKLFKDLISGITIINKKNNTLS